MTSRQETLLKQIIEKHIDSAEPVASAFLSEKVGVSSATIRNEMVVLEESGFITQPHTSAGRIPTTKGYQHYIASYLQPKQPTAKQKEVLQSALQQERPVKHLAKALSDQTHLAVLVAFSENDFYYTGLSQLFSQPEFAAHVDQVISLSAVLDAFDEVLRDLYGRVDKEVEVLLGEENPLKADTALFATKAEIKQQEGVLAILGPSRVDYNRVGGLLEFAKQSLSNNLQ